MCVNKTLLALCCMTGKPGIDFIFHETLDEIHNRIGYPSPYRNPDKTLASLMMSYDSNS